jgi:hypothetical protein
MCKNQEWQVSKNKDRTLEHMNIGQNLDQLFDKQFERCLLLRRMWSVFPAAQTGLEGITISSYWESSQAIGCKAVHQVEWVGYEVSICIHNNGCDLVTIITAYIVTNITHIYSSTSNKVFYSFTNLKHQTELKKT